MTAAAAIFILAAMGRQSFVPLDATWFRDSFCVSIQFQSKTTSPGGDSNDPQIHSTALVQCACLANGMHGTPHLQNCVRRRNQLE
jgi:hypothetical protein